VGGADRGELPTRPERKWGEVDRERREEWHSRE